MKRRNFLTASLLGIIGSNALNLHASEKPLNNRSLRYIQSKFKSRKLFAKKTLISILTTLVARIIPFVFTLFIHH